MLIRPELVALPGPPLFLFTLFICSMKAVPNMGLRRLMIQSRKIAPKVEIKRDGLDVDKSRFVLEGQDIRTIKSPGV
jgi:hypothetical protein